VCCYTCRGFIHHTVATTWFYFISWNFTACIVLYGFITLEMQRARNAQLLHPDFRKKKKRKKRTITVIDLSTIILKIRHLK
jgi:accessory gene regulator protein AgrB